MINKLVKKYISIPLVAKASLWFVLCTMLQKCIAFITVPIFTRLMPTEEYGLYSTYMSWYGILTVFCTLNAHSVKYVNDYTKANTKEEKDFSAVPLLSLSVVITLSLFVVYVTFHGFFDKLIRLPFVLVCLLFAQILFEPPVNFWTMQQRFEFRYVILVARTIIMVLANAILGILFVYFSSSNAAVARACSIVLVQCIFGGVFYVYFWKRGRCFFSTKGWRQALKVQVPLLPHSLSLTILSNSDRIMIANLVGVTEAGIYSVAYSAGYIVNVLKNSIVDALKPWIYQKIKSRQFEDIRKTVNVVMIFVTMISIIFTAFAPEIIMIMAPERYHQAVYVIPPVAASSYFTFLYNIFSVVGLYFEKSNKIMWASISGAITNLILNTICIPIFGFIAAAYTTLVCYMFFACAHYIIMRNICKNDIGDIEIYDIPFILGNSVFMVAMTIIFMFTYNNLFFRYAIVLVMIIITIINRKTFIHIFRQLNMSKERKK